MLYNNSNQFKRIFLRFESYNKIIISLIRHGVPIKELIKTKFPYYFKDNRIPCSLSIELGNICNLKCAYCNIPHLSSKREFMGELVFEQLIENLKKESINRIRIGGGEPTLHPHFNIFMTEIRKYTKFLSIVTNAQWIRPDIKETLIDVPFDLIEVSMDAGGKEVYESSRVGANFELFESNLCDLKKLKDKSRKKILINMRLMVRPSKIKTIDNETIKWKRYCDSVMPQIITNIPETDYFEDVFIPSQREGCVVPKCTLPFKDLLVKSSGEIPYCQVTGNTIYRKRLIAGNISNDSISTIWNEKIKSMRTAHRMRIFDSFETEYCKGCSGR
jgi:MoaA/NifB/PqqE/SkfB family radical SAM enzyme